MASNNMYHRGSPLEAAHAQTGSSTTTQCQGETGTVLAPNCPADVGQYMMDTADALRMEGYSLDSFPDLLYDPYQICNAWDFVAVDGHDNAQAVGEAVPDRAPKGAPKETLTGLECQTDFGNYDALFPCTMSQVSSRWFDSQSRDQLLFAMADRAQTHPSQRVDTLRTRFPSVELLNELTGRFFDRQERKLDSWIHSTTFQAEDGSIELMAIIVASSALNTSSSALRQLGADMYGVIRSLILAKVSAGCSVCEQNTESPQLDNDHKYPCKLQLYQAFLLHLELELWHDEDISFSRAGRLANVIPRVRCLLSDQFSMEVDKSYSFYGGKPGKHDRMRTMYPVGGTAPLTWTENGPAG